MRWSVILSVLALTGCGSETVIPGGGELIGHVELTSGYPAIGTLVQIEGTPLGAIVDTDGNYRITDMPPGTWALRIMPQGELASLGSRRALAATNEGEITTLDITLFNPGVVGGRLLPPDGADTPPVFVAISDLGLATAPTEAGGYLLTGVAPGSQDVTLVIGEASVAQEAMVEPQTMSMVDFELQQLNANPGIITGTARDSRGSASGVTVELVSALDGRVVASMETDDFDKLDYEFIAKPGSYMIRASRGSGPIGLHPPVVLAAEQTLFVNVTIPESRRGADPDGDGNREGIDEFPYHFGIYLDSDDDGVPDEWDLDSDNDQVVDKSNPTTDTDEDGMPDAGDNCAAVPNPNQIDTDQDGMGDVCDSNGTVITLFMNTGDVRSSHQSACSPDNGSLDTLFQVSSTNSCNFDRAFFMIHNLEAKVPEGAIIHEAKITVQDIAGSSTPLTVQLRAGIGPTPGSTLPTDKDMADSAWANGIVLGSFTEERQGIANSIDIKTHVQNVVNNYYYAYGDSFLFMLGTETTGGEAYYRSNVKLTVSYTP